MAERLQVGPPHCVKTNACSLSAYRRVSFPRSATDWPMSFVDHMEALSVKVPVSSSVCPRGPDGDILGASAAERALLSSSTVGFDNGEPSFQPLLGHDSLMSERDSQADASDTPHSFELCPPRGPSDCTSSSFDIVFEDSGCDRDADADTESDCGAASPNTETDRNSSSSSHTRRPPSAPASSSTPVRPTSLTLALPSAPPSQRLQPSPKVLSQSIQPSFMSLCRHKIIASQSVSSLAQFSMSSGHHDLTRGSNSIA